MTVRPGSELEFHELTGRRSADPLADLAAPVSVRVVEIESGVERSPHRHPNSCEVVYVVEGAGLAWQDGAATEITAGDIVYIPIGTPHATIATTERLRLVCYFPHPDLAANIEELDGVIRL